MIRLDIVDNEVKIYFSGENFNEILSLLKARHFEYDPKEKSWTGSNCQIYNILPELTQIEEFEINESIKKLIEPKPGIKFIRRQFKKERLKSEPLGEYQIEGIKKFINTNAVICGDDCGLGKTYQTISALNHLVYDDEIDKIFIVSVPEVLYNWKKELLEFSDYFKEEDIIIASKDNRSPFDSNSKVIICSYNTFLLIEKYYYQLATNGKKLTKKSKKKTIPFNDWGKNICCILDEAHKIKGIQTITSKSILKYRDYFKYKYELTGTPYPNNVSEIYNLLTFLDDNIIYADYVSFISSIANIGNRFSSYAINYFYPDKVEKFIERIQPYIFRRFKKDVLPDMPELNVKKIFIEINDRQKEIYQKIISEKLQSLKEEKGEILIKDVMNNFPYLTLACSDPSILKGRLISQNSETLLTFTKEVQKLLDIWKFEYNSKLDSCSSIVENHIKEEKIIIWSSHPATINLLGEYYKKYDPILIHGQSHLDAKEDKEEYRNNSLNEFKSNKERNLIIMNPSVMGTGINIQESTVSIFFDRSYDIKTYLQATARNHRANSKKDVTCYILILDKTLELKQDRILDKKEDLNNNLLNKDTLPIEEWKKIFNGGR